jgi:hypothetical protein
MDASDSDSGRRVADIIGQRVGAGENEQVAGWQKMLTGLLENMAPFLLRGRLVTFHTLLPAEKAFFETLHKDIVVPGHVTALYISPSVRHQMMFGNRGAEETDVPAYRPEEAADDGILLACREKNYQTIVNVLFAHPPHTPAIDVYDHGGLIAGYSYASIKACREEVSTVIQTHLPMHGNPA